MIPAEFPHVFFKGHLLNGFKSAGRTLVYFLLHMRVPCLVLKRILFGLQTLQHRLEYFRVIVINFKLIRQLKAHINSAASVSPADADNKVVRTGKPVLKIKGIKLCHFGVNHISAGKTCGKAHHFPQDPVVFPHTKLPFFPVLDGSGHVRDERQLTPHNIPLGTSH